ncbi:MAG TPA: MBL fold metallo-hydrolase [Gemmatimonadales bacterium]|nr:MBL fold metallo-hydrolase [Gemmatimonadales bacterium]
MALVQTFRLGSLTCHALEGGLQRLDGGAMFGVVPKPLWEKRIPADERNRIPLAMRCLLIEHGDGLVLVDSAVGNKEDAKFADIYGIENPGNPTQLEEAIRAAGHRPEDVRWVLNTHLHFDHAGGNTVRMPDGEIVVAFPNATYVVQKGEFEYATHPNERVRASYLAPNFAPVAAAGRFRFIEGEVEVLPGIRALPTPGHVPFHQSFLVTSDGESLVYLGDLVPTSAHLPAPWIMGYDVEPLVTLETKKRVLTRAANEGWTLFFEHDPTAGMGRIQPDPRRGWSSEIVKG